MPPTGKHPRAPALVCQPLASRSRIYVTFPLPTSFEGFGGLRKDVDSWELCEGVLHETISAPDLHCARCGRVFVSQLALLCAAARCRRPARTYGGRFRGIGSRI